MSYTINNYCFLGIPVSEIVNNLNPSIAICTGNSGIYVVIDKRFVALADGVENFSRNWKCSSVDRMVSEGFFDFPERSKEGANALFCRALLMTAGITDSKFYEGWNNLLNSLVSDIIIIPFDVIPIEINGKICESGLVHVENSFLINLVTCFAENSRLTIVNPSQDCNKQNPVKVSCLKTALHNLLKIHSDLKEESINEDASMRKIYSIEAWMHYLLDMYLESKDCYCDIRVASTYYGNVHRLGGMEPKVPYVVFGLMQSYDEDGWNNPRKSDPETLMQARDCLLGETSSGDWVKFTPQFGG